MGWIPRLEGRLITPSRGRLTRLTPTVTERMRPWRRLAPTPTITNAMRQKNIHPGIVRIGSTLGQHLAGHPTSVGGAASMAETLTEECFTKNVLKFADSMTFWRHTWIEHRDDG